MSNYIYSEIIQQRTKKWCKECQASGPVNDPYCNKMCVAYEISSGSEMPTNAWRLPGQYGLYPWAEINFLSDVSANLIGSGYPKCLGKRKIIRKNPLTWGCVCEKCPARGYNFHKPFGQAGACDSIPPACGVYTQNGLRSESAKYHTIEYRNGGDGFFYPRRKMVTVIKPNILEVTTPTNAQIQAEVNKHWSNPTIKRFKITESGTSEQTIDGTLSQSVLFSKKYMEVFYRRVGSYRTRLSSEQFYRLMQFWSRESIFKGMDFFGLSNIDWNYNTILLNESNIDDSWTLNKQDLSVTISKNYGNNETIEITRSIYGAVSVTRRIDVQLNTTELTRIKMDVPEKIPLNASYYAIFQPSQQS